MKNLKKGDPMNIELIYCITDDFVKFCEKNFFKNVKSVGRKPTLSRSIYLTLAIIKQRFGFKTNRQLYDFVKEYMSKDIPSLPSYNQFCEGISSNLGYLMLLNSLFIKINRAKGSPFYIIDSTSVPICANAHRYNLSIDLGLAGPGKNLNGWYYGFKLHLIINARREIVGLQFTSASVDDRKALDSKMIEGLTGWLVGDKGYIDRKRAKKLLLKGLKLVTRQRKNMPKVPCTKKQLLLLQSRQIVETSFSILKHQFNLIYKHARSLKSFFSQAFAAITAYSLYQNKDLARLESTFELITIS